MTKTWGYTGLCSKRSHPRLLSKICQVPSLHTSASKTIGMDFRFFISLPFVSQKTRQDVKSSDDAKNIPQIPQMSRSSLTAMAMTPNLSFLCQEGGLQQGDQGQAGLSSQHTGGQACWEPFAYVCLCLYLTVCPNLPLSFCQGHSWKVSEYLNPCFPHGLDDQLWTALPLAQFLGQELDNLGALSLSYGSLRQSSAPCQGWGWAWLEIHLGCQL